ncbi:MAG: peptidase [Betaproteobacteria bacterium]|nr:peptidase [Betaproteobacteria bacterium]
MRPNQFASLFFAAAVASVPAFAAEPEISPAVKEQFTAVSGNAQVKQALDFIKADDTNALAELKAIVAIPSPPFKEQVRAQDFQKRLTALGFSDASIDKEGNVIAVRRGTGNGPKLIVSAHLDTVFPAGTDLTIKEKDGKLYAPGIGDDTRGLVELLSMVRALNAANIKTVGDLWFVGTVGEEGLGDLRGARALFRDHKDIDGFISIDGARAERITYVAVGSHRYRITYTGPGGHSFSAFGRPSAIHAIGRAIAKISELKTPTEPKTTFTVGTIKGGTSVNAIAEEAVMELDMRSVSTQALLDVETQALKAIKDAAVEENARWKTDKITVDIKLVGDRPAGQQAVDSPIIQTALLSLRAVGLKPELESPGSTDSNVAISLGIPAMTIGRGGLNGDNHSINEWWDPKDAYLGAQKTLLTILTLVGVDGVSKPVLTKAPIKK